MGLAERLYPPLAAFVAFFLSVSDVTDILAAPLRRIFLIDRGVIRNPFLNRKYLI